MGSESHLEEICAAPPPQGYDFWSTGHLWLGRVTPAVGDRAQVLHLLTE